MRTTPFVLDKYLSRMAGLDPHIDHCDHVAKPHVMRQQPCTQNLSTGTNNSAAHQEMESAAAAKNKPIDFRCKRPTQTA